MEEGVDIRDQLMDNTVQDVPLDLTKAAEIKMETEELDEFPKCSQIHKATDEEQTVPLNLKVEGQVEQVQDVPPSPQDTVDPEGQEQDGGDEELRGIAVEEQLIVAQKPRHTAKKKMEGRIEIVRKVIQKFFCKICMEEVPSLDKLVIHLDREHKIRVKGPPIVVDMDDRDNKQDLKITSDLMKSVDNQPRSTEPLLDSDTEDEDDDDSEADFDMFSAEDGLDFEDEVNESSYSKLKDILQRRRINQEGNWQRKIAAQLQDPEFKKEMQYVQQCGICWVEVPVRPRFRLLKAMHKRQHMDKEYKDCPMCGMGFLYQHQLDKHLEDLAVPVVPSEMSTHEAEDLLYITHTCPGGLAGSNNYGCGAEFSNRKCLLFHLTRFHDHYHRCPNCEKPYVHYSALRKHIQRSHNWEERMICCPVPNCEKRVGTKRGLTSHFIHYHTKEEKEQFNKSSTEMNGHEEPQGAGPNIVRHNPPQTFWRMVMDRLVKSRNYHEKRTVERAKQKILRKPQKSNSITPVSQSQKPIIPKIELVKEDEDCTDPLSKPLVKTSSRITKGSRMTVSTTRRRSRTFQPNRFDGIDSLPPKKYLRGMPVKRRNMFQHRQFTQVCGLCSRSFRTLMLKNRHLADTHKIDFSLERPYKCRVEGCQEARSDTRYLLGHIRTSHAPSDEEALILQSLEEDKTTEGEESFLYLDNLTVDKVEVEEEVVDVDEELNDSYLNFDPELESSPIECQVFNGTVATVCSTSSPPSLIRRSIPATFPRGPKAIAARRLLENFKLGNSYYCPECEPNSRKPISVAWNVIRHMHSFHPNSLILTEPESVEVEVIGSGRENEMVQFHQGQDASPEQDNQHQGPDSDFITSASDPSTLIEFRQFLQQYRISPQNKRVLSLACPLCVEAGPSSSNKETHDNVYNLQQHIFKLHPGSDSDLLRKSKLKEFILTNPEVPKLTNKGKGKLVGRKMKHSVFRGAGRIIKMKARAITFSRQGQGTRKSGCKKGQFISPRIAKLSTYKTVCGQKFYCPICASSGKQRIFGYTPNLSRHVAIDHPNSDLLKLSNKRQKVKRRRGKEQSDSDSSSDEENVEVDDLPHGSDSEFEVEPETEQPTEEEDGLIEVAPPYHINEENSDVESIDIERVSPSRSLLNKNIEKEPKVGASTSTVDEKLCMEVKIKLEQATSSGKLAKKKCDFSTETGSFSNSIKDELRGKSYNTALTPEQISSTTNTMKRTHVDENEDGVNIQRTSPQKRKSISRPKRGRTQYSPPYYTDDTSEEEFPVTRLQLQVERSTSIIKPKPELQPDDDDKEEESTDEEKNDIIKCPICFKIFRSRRALVGHKSWHTRKINDLPWTKKKAKLDEDEDEDDLWEEVAPDAFHPEPGEENEGDSSNPDDEVTSFNVQDIEPDDDADAGSDFIDIMNDTPESLLDSSKCTYCDEWFSSSMEMGHHILRDHSN